jgi:hypothetical protein
MTHLNDSVDDFWNIALYDNSTRIDKDDDDDNEPFDADTSFRDYHNDGNTYKLSIPPYGCIHLNLIPLSITVQHNETAVIPLGAEAWYGSALLAAIFTELLSHNPSPTNGATTILQAYIDSNLQRGNYSINILELGSGSVGLSSLAAGLSVTGYMHQHQQHPANCTLSEHHSDPTLSKNIECCVILTDSDPHVLQQLEYNIHTTTRKLQHQFSNRYALPEFIVHHLDWNNINDNAFPNINTNDNHNVPQLVIGSELIYNAHTARSCTNAVFQQLQYNPKAFVLIVNNVNRDGWDAIFLSTIYKTPGIRFVLETLTSSTHLHGIASNLIRPGGTLNPFSDFGVCCIWNEAV